MARKKNYLSFLCITTADIILELLLGDGTVLSRTGPLGEGGATCRLQAIIWKLAIRFKESANSVQEHNHIFGFCSTVL